jgi:hypothetical protein
MTDISFSFLQVAKSDTESENATESEVRSFGNWLALLPKSLKSMLICALKKIQQGHQS